MNTKALVTWFWNMLGDAVEGFGHGAVIGTGLDAVKQATDSAAVHVDGAHELVAAIMCAGAIGAIKQALIYLNSNRLPPILSPAVDPSQPAKIP